MYKIIGTTVLAAAGLCGSVAAWSHAHNSRADEARGHARGERFSRGERGERNIARDFGSRRRRGGERGWGNRER